MQNENVFRLLFAVFFCCLIFSSCKKPVLEGSQTLPPERSLNTQFTDTLTVVSTTIHEDTLSGDGFTTYQAGSLSDPSFGLLTAKIYAQLMLTEENPELGDKDSLFLDSVVLNLLHT
ncbi:MAG: DUF4270 family protein, partial [Bacteroidetes bacterium]|nr:DUF4270 family protein [Bacteroidota bacterium]